MDNEMESPSTAVDSGASAVDSGDIEIEVEAPELADAPQVPTTPQTPVQPDDAPDEALGERAQRRIRTLVSERKQVEAELAASRKALEDAQAKLKAASTQSRTQAEHSLTETEARVAAELSQAEQDYRNARASDDHDKEVDALKRMAASQTQKLALQARRNMMTAHPATEDVEVEIERPAPVVQAPKVDPRTQKWVENNQWVLAIADKNAPAEDREMAQHAGRLHEYAAKVMQLDPSQPGDADEYWRIIDDGMRKQYPHRFKGETAGKQITPSVRRPTGGTNKMKVKPLPHEIKFAEKHGVSLESIVRERIRLMGVPK